MLKYTLSPEEEKLGCFRFADGLLQFISGLITMAQVIFLIWLLFFGGCEKMDEYDFKDF